MEETCRVGSFGPKPVMLLLLQAQGCGSSVREQGKCEITLAYRIRVGRRSCVKARRCTMKRSAMGLIVRFLNVATFTGHGRAGKSTGNTLSDLKYATELGIDVMNWPSARKWVMTEMDRVTTLAFGMASPRARQTSAKLR